MTEQLYRWVKYKKDKPTEPGTYAVRMRHGNDLEEDPYTEDFVELDEKYEWQMAVGWEIIEWLQGVTPSPVSGSLEEAAEEYLNEKPDWAMDQNHFHTTRSIYLGDMKAAFLAGANYVNSNQ